MTILATHRYGIEYVEHCKVVAADDRLSYVRRDNGFEKYWSIPYANTAVLLLGPGTSLTQPAARLLGSQGVLVGFCGGGAVPVFLGALNEYRPTQYLQAWISLWQDPARRLEAAKHCQRVRIDFITTRWRTLSLAHAILPGALQCYQQHIESAVTNEELLLAEAHFSKTLYALLSTQFAAEKFVREPRAKDPINDLLDQGNYLAYGLAAACLWVLGIPHSLPLNHGQTRRGALVFDIADLVKDACIMPQAFESGVRRQAANQFRQRALEVLDDAHALKLMFETVIALTRGVSDPGASSSAGLDSRAEVPHAAAQPASAPEITNPEFSAPLN